MGAPSDPNWRFEDWFRFHRIRWEGSEAILKMHPSEEGIMLRLVLLAFKLDNKIPSDKGALMHFLRLNKLSDGDELYDNVVLSVLKRNFQLVPHNGDEVWFNSVVEDELFHKYGKKKTQATNAKGGKEDKNDNSLKDRYNKPSNDRGKSRGASDGISDGASRGSSNGKILKQVVVEENSFEKWEREQKNGVDNQLIEDGSNHRSGDGLRHSLYSILFSFGKKVQEKNLLTNLPEWLDKSEIPMLRNLLMICQGVNNLPGDFLENLETELLGGDEYSPEFTDNGELEVVFLEEEFSVVFVPSSSPREELFQLDDRLVIEVFEKDPGTLDENYPGIAIVTEKIDPKKPKVLPQKKQLSKAEKNLADYPELAARMFDVYPQKGKDHKTHQRTWPAKTEKYLRGMSLEDAAATCDKFCRWMNEIFVPHYEKTLVAKGFDTTLFWPGGYILSGDWNLVYGELEHPIPGWQWPGDH